MMMMSVLHYCYWSDCSIFCFFKNFRSSCIDTAPAWPAQQPDRYNIAKRFMTNERHACKPLAGMAVVVSQQCHTHYIIYTSIAFSHAAMQPA